MDKINGVGLGLRIQHLKEILANKPKLGWLEILVDNFMYDTEETYQLLDLLREEYDFVFHSVGFNIGSVDSVDLEYFKEYKKLIDRYNPLGLSDHLAWTGFGGRHHHDLLPLPYTEETLSHCTSKIDKIQNLLKQKIIVENPTSYINILQSNIPEAVFLKDLAKKTGCDLLLDINNVYVNSVNHNFDPFNYLEEFQIDKIAYIHLAGYEDFDTYLLDSHGSFVQPKVWELYQKFTALIGIKPTMIEWDNNIPEFSVLQLEARKIASILNIQIENAKPRVAFERAEESWT